MPNPFEAPDSAYLALVNARGQWSLWPAHLTVPDGWDVSHGPDARASCLSRIESVWTDLRPMTAGGTENPAAPRTETSNQG